MTRGKRYLIVIKNLKERRRKIRQIRELVGLMEDCADTQELSYIEDFFIYRINKSSDEKEKINQEIVLVAFFYERYIRTGKIDNRLFQVFCRCGVDCDIFAKVCEGVRSLYRTNRITGTEYGEFALQIIKGL